MGRIIARVIDPEWLSVTAHSAHIQVKKTATVSVLPKAIATTSSPAADLRLFDFDSYGLSESKGRRHRGGGHAARPSNEARHALPPSF